MKFDYSYNLITPIIRAFLLFRMSSGVAVALMTYKEMLEKSVLFTMSQAWQLGRAVMRARAQHTNVIEAVTTQQKGMVLLTGKVQSTVRKRL